MRKKDYSEELQEIVDNTKYVKVKIEDEIHKSFMSYAMMVNMSRAIPDVRDGLKPVHRRILYAMSELGLTHDKPFKKCARIVGECLGKYHPHGDSSVYEALVRLAQPFTINMPLIDGHGNFGSVDADPPAAMRYTEARLSAVASEMLRDIDKNTVDFRPNFDETEQEPIVLPSRFPNLLVNGSDGIAVGMATNIPPHNLGEVIDGVVALIENPDIEIEQLMRIIPAPDYPTGGIIMGRAALRHAYKTGHGNIVLRATTEIEEHNGRNRIIVTEIPYQVNKAKLVESIALLVRDKRIEGITSVDEESDRHGMRIVITLKKEAQPQVVLTNLFKLSQLQISMGINFLALVGNEPKVLNLKEMLYYYLEHQKEVVLRRTKFDLEKAEERAHILEGLVKALANIDEVVAIIKASKDKIDAAAKLMKRFILTDRQANAILEMRLQRLTSLEVEKLKAELEELRALIIELKSIIASQPKLLALIKQELLEIKDKYAVERVTELTTDYGDIDIADLIEKEDVAVSMTHCGYIKRLPLTEYKAQRRGGKGSNTHTTKEEDFVERMFVTNTHHDLLFFTNMGKVYRIKAFEVPEATKGSKGRAIVNLLSLENGESVAAVIPMEDYDMGHIMLATKFGMIKKTKCEEFARIARTGKIAIGLNEGDQLIGAAHTTGADEIIMASSSGKCIRFSEEDVRPMGRGAAGVKSMNIDRETEAIVDMSIIEPGCEILTVSANGYGKRSDPDDYRLQSRAGKGIKAGIFNEKTGPLVNLKQVRAEQDIMLISDNGTMIRTKASYISKISRDTQGVRIMRIGEGAKIVAVAVAEPQEDEEDGESAE
ncbi:MAG: DNA gyrase subunit A [Eubacteriales bacterium]|nr:DNA gyrase subunit A [Eubacteriales bacterium]